jgi:hypothetical protein
LRGRLKNWVDRGQRMSLTVDPTYGWLWSRSSVSGLLNRLRPARKRGGPWWWPALSGHTLGDPTNRHRVASFANYSQFLMSYYPPPPQLLPSVVRRVNTLLLL